jgi:hypothetical protein
MGISIKRRGNAPIVKTIYGAALNKVLEEKDVAAAAEIVQRGVMDLVEGRTKMGQLIITKSLKAEYTKSLPAHKVLADRIKARDPGNAPAAGDRMASVYIRPPIGQQVPKLQGERIETPQFVRERGLRVDYEFYIEHQLMNPISEMFGLLLEQVPGFRENMLPDGWRDMEQEQLFAVREKVAAQLLFGEALSKLREQGKRAFIATLGGSSSSGSGSGSGSGSKSGITAGVTQLSTAAQSRRPTGMTTTASKSSRQSPPKKQVTLDTWFADSVLLQLSRKKATARDRLRAELEAETTAVIDA